MLDEPIVQLTAIVTLGIGAQWIAWRLRMPAILLLLGAGFIAGPITGIVEPDNLLGELLFPVVSASVSIILFEGGLSLKWSELREVGPVIRNLVILGSLLTWFITTIAAHLVLGFDWPVALLLGSVLIVTGPTVIVPLLRHVRPVGRVNSIVKWEGMLNDPIGAVLAVLVFEALLTDTSEPGALVWSMGRALVFRTVLGGLAAIVLAWLLRRFLVPDFLQSSFTLMVVLLVYVVSDHLQAECGLLAVTVMGFGMANQKWVSVRPILEFKENLRVLLLSVLFVVLAARVPRSAFDELGWETAIFVTVLVLVVRPLAVLISTFTLDLSWAERGFIGFMAPRGVVAAAVAAVFSLRASVENVAGLETLMPVTFAVVLGTAAIYGLSAAPLAWRLGLATKNPRKVLFFGADPWTCELALALEGEGFRAMVVDSDRGKVMAARGRGLEARNVNVLSEQDLDGIDLDGVGAVVALTANDEVNSLVALHFSGIFETASVFQLPPEGIGSDSTTLPRHLRARFAFSPEASYERLSELVDQGAVVRRTPLTEEFGFADYRRVHGSSAIPMFIVREDQQLVVCTAGGDVAPEPGDVLIGLVTPSTASSSEATDG
jgi:NhaP-type Na+/H+ or K+/H+ antiporter